MISIQPAARILTCLICLLSALECPTFAQAPPASAESKRALEGKRIYTSTCSGCHGLDGKGSERAPSIASVRIQRFSDAQMANIISNGVSGTGMPAFHTLSGVQVRSLVSYVRTLQGRNGNRALPGNPERGREVFYGKGECGSCHSVAGKGGFMGPDLTAYGSNLSAPAIVEGLLNPKRIVPAGYKAVTVTTRDGNRITGILRNEDNFSVQMLAGDGTVHFFEKSELKSLEYQTLPLMPANYGERLTRDEINDLVSYLMNASSSHKPTKAEHEEE